MVDCSVDVTAIIGECLADACVVGQEWERRGDTLDHPARNVRGLVGLWLGAGGLSDFDVGWTSQRASDVADR